MLILLRRVVARRIETRPGVHEQVAPSARPPVHDLHAEGASIHAHFDAWAGEFERLGQPWDHPAVAGGHELAVHADLPAD
eukprot:scaffold5546_cov65-Phaeocystis_antarctica.AAC.6